jgi:hypothetical protein
VGTNDKTATIKTSNLFNAKFGGGVPEPATIIKLAFGGLALLRRGH